MDLSTLYLKENLLDLSSNQKDVVSNIEHIIGNHDDLNAVYASLCLNSVAGKSKPIVLHEALCDKKELSVSAIASLRNQFAVKMFKTLFAKNANEEENCQLLSECATMISTR